MTITYDDFIVCAGNMLADSKTEIDLRNSISRSYYGLLHYGQGLIEHKRLIKSKCEHHISAGNTHMFVTCVLYNNDRRTLVRHINNCKKRRVNADYDMQSNIATEYAEDHLGEVRRAIIASQTDEFIKA